MAKRFHFDTHKAIATAWDVLWANNLKLRKKEKNQASRWAARTYYLCAADLEQQVRAFAQDTVDGKPWRSTAANYGGWGSRIRLPGDLQAAVRSWLFGNSKLTYHNFGRGHISGARFRPVGQPISPSEKKTLERKARPPRPRLEHYSRNGHGGRPACVLAQAAAKGRRLAGYRSSKAWSTRDAGEVTCPRCLKLKPWEAVETTKAMEST